MSLAVPHPPIAERRQSLAHDAAVPRDARAGHAGMALTLRGVSKRFGGVKAVDAIDMHIARGEIHAVIGPNGAGKSTLLNLISGLYPADAGAIEIAGTTRVRARELARLGISRTFQNLALFEGLSVAQNIALGRRARLKASLVDQLLGLPRARLDRIETHRRVRDLLGFLELGDVRDRRLEGLPYGVLKRIELARAIIAEPRLLLLDEPLAGMTGADKPEMARFIRATRDRFGTTIVLIEHDVDIVMGLADRITVLDYGRKIADGTPDEVRRNPAVIAAYLGEDEDVAAGEPTA